MRLAIIADSLGMPRSTMNMSKVWTSQIIRMYKNFETYTFLKRYLTTSDILDIAQDWLVLLDPDVIVFQVGIVDCVRRALPRKLLKVGSRIPIFANALHWFSNKYHYTLTAAFKFKESPCRVFQNNIFYILDICEKQKIKTAFVRIADAGPHLENVTFDPQSEIVKYNELLRNAITLYQNATYLDPYGDLDSKEYTVCEDGHHLNEKGHQLVFNALSNWLDSLSLR